MNEDLTPIYFRVSPGIWRQRWSEDERYLALYLLTCQHRTIEGLFVLPKLYMCADLKWLPERLGESFASLCADDFADYDEEAEVCLIVKALHYQPPRNPNMITAAIRRVQNVPKTRLDERFLACAIRYCLPFAESLRESLPERYGKPQLFSALLSTAHSASARAAKATEPRARAQEPVDKSTQYCPNDGATLQADGHCPVCQLTGVTS